LDGILLCYAAFAIVYVIPPLGANLWLGAEYPSDPGYKRYP
jgi:hypothetical protein